MKPEEVRKYYKDTREKASKNLSRQNRISGVLSFLRLLIFVSGLAVTIKLFTVSTVVGGLSLVISAVLFGALVRIFARRTALRDYYRNLEKLNVQELNSLDGDWSGFEEGNKYIKRDHEFSHDIDMFGKGSFFQYINRTVTGSGSDMLAGWLNDPYRLAPDFLKRREAVQELSEMVDWRQNFITIGRTEKNEREETEQFMRWMFDAPSFAGRRLFTILSWVLPAISILLLTLMILANLHYSLFVLSILVNLLMISIRFSEINRIHQVVSRQAGFLSRMSSLLGLIEDKSFNAEYLVQLQKELKKDSMTACDNIKRLSKIVQAFDNRLNMLIGGLLDGLLLWDYHCILKLERWRDSVKDVVPGWFRSLASFDAFVSLAGYGYNNPGYCYPELSVGEPWFEAADMGHPLIPEEKLVTNNYQIPSKGITGIITGANMSGKSTFLRTVVLNLITAMCGGTVSASRFVFTPCRIFTSMRTTDSLAENESYFYAELKRLHELKELLATAPDLFFALDEILKGTNSRDKSEGSWLFLEKIMPSMGTGLVATHDISLGKLADKYPDRVVNHCFEIDIKDGEMIFDYTIRAGVTTRMNAALLMKQQGIID